MFDDLLNKKAFVEKYRTMRYTDHQIEREWQKVVTKFISRCLDQYLAVIPEEVKTQLQALRDKQTDEGDDEYAATLKAYLDANPGAVDEETIKQTVAKDIQREYT